MAADSNNIKEDFLDEDPEIPSQKYVLLSFISPENVLAKKDNFFFEKFLEDYEFQLRTKGFETFVAGFVQKANSEITSKADTLEVSGNSEAADILRKNTLRVDSFLTDFHDHVAKNQKEMTQTTIVESYKDFLARKQPELEDKFFAANDFRTTIRGLKVRGSYSTPTEAEARAKKLQRSDQYHNILVGQVGKWLPWDPNPGQIEKQEYAEEQLNELMQKYKENEDARDQFYKEQKKQRPSKQVFGAVEDGGAADSSASQEKNELHSMFSDSGDLAIQRKMEAAVAAIKSSETETAKE
jgi:hypothetical protein